MDIMKTTEDKMNRILEQDSATRKQYPMFDGLLAYFPDALAEVSRVSWVGNKKHNGEDAPLHHARGKSMDHANCVMRHLTQSGETEIVEIDGVEYVMRHSAYLVWRALALLQQELEEELGLPLPRGARE